MRNRKKIHWARNRRENVKLVCNILASVFFFKDQQLTGSTSLLCWFLFIKTVLKSLVFHSYTQWNHVNCGNTNEMSTGGWPIYWVHQPVKGMKHWMKWYELREYKWNEYVTIAVNRNLSSCENSPKKGFSGLQRDSNPWPAPFNNFQLWCLVPRRRYISSAGTAKQGARDLMGRERISPINAPHMALDQGLTRGDEAANSSWSSRITGTTDCKRGGGRGEGGIICPPDGLWTFITFFVFVIQYRVRNYCNVILWLVQKILYSNYIR